MTWYSFYDPETGLLAAESWDCSKQFADARALHLRLTPIEGHHDRRRVRVNIETGELEAYQPPAPADTEWETYSWDADAWAWVATPTVAALARSARAERDRRLDATVPLSLKYYRLGQPIPKAWADYMQALADVPEQPGFPTAITWPTPPTP